MVTLVQNLEFVVGFCEAEITERFLFFAAVGNNEIIFASMLHVCRIFSVNFSFIDVM